MIHTSIYSGGDLNIHLVGAGGNGSLMAGGLARLSLALAALGKPGLHVTVFDPDTITEANIGRQAFTPADVGQNKAITLVHRLNCFYNLGWEASPNLYSPGDKLRISAPDMIIGCVDTKKARREIGKALGKSYNCYWLDLGNDADQGQVVLGQNSRGLGSRNAYRLPTVLELFPEMAKTNAKEDNAPSCSLAEALEKQDLFINQAVATFALNLLWHLLRHGWINYHGGFINCKTGRTAPIAIDHETWARMGYRPETPKEFRATKIAKK